MSGGAAWTPEEDATVRRLRTRCMGWRDIALHLPGRTAASCRKRILRTLQELDPRKPGSLHRNREALRPGHPVAWTAITAGTVIEGTIYRC